ncbi:hypothetical protein V8C35DRAFT_327792 [Trichoderma chlorosporum]
MRRLRFLRRPFGKGRRQKNLSAAILQLPQDILFLIINNLALHDKFLLSHSCKALRQVTFQDWDIEISRLSFKDQMGFWVGLAYTLPNRWACLKCCKLHPINTSDVPAAFWIQRHREIPCRVEYSRGIEYENYSIQHYHIQLALKLSRLGNIHQLYLAAIINPYTNTRRLSTLPLFRKFTAEPKIINKRFILREQWKISNNASTALPLFPSKVHLYLPVCPHMCISTYGGPAMSRRLKELRIQEIVRNNGMQQLEGSILLKELTLLEDGITLASESPGQWIFNSCLHCPTDFAVIISTDKQKATIQAWHDFGMEGSPIDSWKAHVRDTNAHWHYLGPYVDYTYGSIRKLWSEDFYYGAGTGQVKLQNVFIKLMNSLGGI